MPSRSRRSSFTALRDRADAAAGPNQAFIDLSFDGEDTVRTVILKQIDGQRKLDDMRVAGQNRASL
jgi:hypothetical protein